MRQYSKDPMGAEFVYAIAGKRETDQATVGVRVTFASDVYYTTWRIDGSTVYRRQYSGRNLRHLNQVITDLREGLPSYSEQGAWKT